LSFSWTCYCSNFLRNWFETSGEWILVHWLLDCTSLLDWLLWIFAEIVFLGCLWW
jgi:hypothetical protein